MQFDEIMRYFKKGTTVWASIGYFTIRLRFQTNVYFMGYVKDSNQRAKYYGKGEANNYFQLFLIIYVQKN